MKYDAIFFDLDGTVMDSLQDIVNAVNHALRRYGFGEWTAEALRPHLGWGVGPLFRRILPPDTPEALREEMMRFYRPYYAAHTCDVGKPFPGILPMLARLREAGLRLAILSNKPDAALQPIVGRFFADLVDLSAGEKPEIRAKPHPEMIEDAARRLGVSLKRCLYVGDSEVDIDTARNVGIDCVCVSWGFRTPEALRRAGAGVVIHSPEALIPIALEDGCQRLSTFSG